MYSNSNVVLAQSYSIVLYLKDITAAEDILKQCYFSSSDTRNKLIFRLLQKLIIAKKPF